MSAPSSQPVDEATNGAGVRRERTTGSIRSRRGSFSSLLEAARDWSHSFAESVKRQHEDLKAAAKAALGKEKATQEEADFFSSYSEANRYQIHDIIGKGSYGVVCSATDRKTGEKVAIKKIEKVFDHVSDATRILREVKLVRLLKHPDIVEIKHIMLPPNPDGYDDLYVVFELMETDLHQVIKANDDLTPEHHQFFLYQMLRGLKYVHGASVYHRDLKPKNILANADCKLKLCDFGLARPSFTDTGPTNIFWTDYVATRWYRAPELCGSFFAHYTPSIDVWSIGCIFAEIITGRPLFPGRNVVHQLEIITDLLGSPSEEEVAKVRNDKARRFLQNMAHKPGVDFATKFPKATPAARDLLRRLLAFDPAKRPTCEQALEDPYFAGLHDRSREPDAAPISKLEFDFERAGRKLTPADVRHLLYEETLFYHPDRAAEYRGNAAASSYVNPSAVDNFKAQFAHLEQGVEGGAFVGKRYTSTPCEAVVQPQAANAGAGLVRSDSVTTHTPVAREADVDGAEDLVRSTQTADELQAMI